MFTTNAHKLTAWLGWVVIVATGSLLIGQGCATYQSEYDDDEAAPYTQGEQMLDAYGRWVVVEPFGQCWQPRVGNRWAPFTDGQWVLSDQGWVWDSNEPYGWLVYHYGSWDYRDDVGWYWVPSDSWSPAAVQWTEFGDYIGWAPLPPPGVIRSGPWVPDQQRYWTIVLVKQFDAPNVGKHRVVRRAADLSIGRDLNSGTPPTPNVIERITKRKVTQVTIQRQSVTVQSKPRDRVILHRIKELKSGESDKKSRSGDHEASGQKSPGPPDKKEGHKRGSAESDSTGTAKAPEPGR